MTYKSYLPNKGTIPSTFFYLLVTTNMVTLQAPSSYGVLMLGPGLKFSTSNVRRLVRLINNL